MKNKLEPINKILGKTGRKITIADLNYMTQAQTRPAEGLTNLKVTEHLPVIRAKSSIRPSRVGMPLLTPSIGTLYSP
jgi:hypothetical protein